MKFLGRVRIAVTVVLCGLVLQSAQAASLLPATVYAQACEFRLGFKSLRDQIPDKVGRCLENESTVPETGNIQQVTSGGMLVWAKATNVTSFTDGYRTWLIGPKGLEERLNADRFPWEQDATIPIEPSSVAVTTTPTRSAPPVPSSCKSMFPDDPTITPLPDYPFPTYSDPLLTYIQHMSNRIDLDWCRNFEFYGRTYVKPNVFSPDEYTILRTSCTSSLSSPYYCPADRSIVFPKTFLRTYCWNRSSRQIVDLIMAHEFAHHVQTLLGISNRVLGKELELQADCISGAHLGHYRAWVELSEAEVLSTVSLLLSIGDDGHGTGDERFLAFKRGFVSAVGLRGRFKTVVRSLNMRRHEQADGVR